MTRLGHHQVRALQAAAEELLRWDWDMGAWYVPDVENDPSPQIPTASCRRLMERGLIECVRKSHDGTHGVEWYGLTAAGRAALNPEGAE